MTDDTTRDDRRRWLSRRTFAGVLGAGTALLAGCGGGGDGAGTATPTEGEDTTAGTTGETTDGEPTTDEPTTETTSEPAGPTKPDREPPAVGSGVKQVEYLSTRGLVAVARSAGGTLLRWRHEPGDPDGMGFHVYRDGEQVTDSPVTDTTNYVDEDGGAESTYHVEAVVDGEVVEESETVETWENPYKEIELDRPEEQDRGTYHPNDGAVADLTGDGTLDWVQKWSPSNAKDPSRDGFTSNVYIDGYTFEGERLWRVDLGQNIRAGAHTTPFLVYDFDGDGVAELAVRTSDGAVSGTGETIGDPNALHVNDTGRVNEGPEFLSVFDGRDGALLATTDFEPARENVSVWGDSYGNREDRYLMTPAYLDGARPSIVSARGYYAKTAVAAFDFRDGELSMRWTFDSADGHPDYEGRGAHTMGAADVDGDGKDEVIHGGFALDHDGSPLHTVTMQNPDVLHYGDFLPDRDGLEIYVPAENAPEGWPSVSMREGESGDYIWSKMGGDVGRAMTADVDPEFKGTESWASGMSTWAPDGEVLRSSALTSINSGIWWTGDLQRELLDHDWGGTAGIGRIQKYRPQDEILEIIERFDGTRSNNWTKGNPCLSGDLLGDWREEVVWRTADNERVRLYVTTHETEHKLPTKLHDPMYRVCLARQNAGYNQPPWPSYYLGTGMDDPPEPSIKPI